MNKEKFHHSKLRSEPVYNHFQGDRRGEEERKREKERGEGEAKANLLLQRVGQAIDSFAEF
jgi:hypothetical protein